MYSRHVHNLNSFNCFHRNAMSFKYLNEKDQNMPVYSNHNFCIEKLRARIYHLGLLEASHYTDLDWWWMNTAATRHRIHSQPGAWSCNMKHCSPHWNNSRWLLPVENLLVFPARAKPTAFECCEPSPTTHCSRGLSCVGICREVGIDFNMTSAMWGPLGHIPPTWAYASWCTKAGDMSYWKIFYRYFSKNRCLRYWIILFLLFRSPCIIVYIKQLDGEQLNIVSKGYITSYIFFTPTVID